MTEIKTDYSNTIFYKIFCNDPTVTELYIGHTTNFVQRQLSHKQCCANATIGTCKLYKVLRDNGGWNNWKMEIIAFHNCDNLLSAKKHEQYYFEEYKATLNSIEPLPNKHLTTAKHKMETQEITKKGGKYICSKCNFKSSNKKDYNRHLTTTKHKMKTTKTSKTTKTTKTLEWTPHTCNCGKFYKHCSGLSRHKQTCAGNNIEKQDIVENPDNTDYKSMFLDAMSQNKEIMELLKEQ